MSGPSIAVRRRWREQVARFVASETFPALLGPSPLRPAARAVLVEELLHGHRSFPVRPIRAAARELIALEAEQAAFEGWTRDRGMGPENWEPGAFALDEWAYAETADQFNELWDAGWVASTTRVADRLGKYAMRRRHRGGWPGKQAREWPGDRRAPMGRSLARLGRRVLEALEGQPDACEAGCERFAGVSVRPRPRGRLEPLGEHPVLGGMVMVPCEFCHGAGDNLRGVLPEVVETAQEKAKSEARDAAASRRAEVRARMTGAVGGGLSTAVQLVPGVRHVALEVDDRRHTVTIRVDGGDLDMVRQAAEDVVSATVFVVVERMALVPGTVRRVRGPVTLVDPSPE